MNPRLCVAAFALGLMAVAWVGYGYLGTNALALVMTVVIGAFYVMGALELRRFHHATASLTQTLAAVPENLAHLGDWLVLLPAALQNPVRLRIEGERAGLPGPAMTPYLVGLLVLLGMLGTFLGMVVTLNGAVAALESTTDLPTIRAALSAPVKGLGVAFGTSIAGVASSAMLGLVSALCRRERLQAVQLLDTRIATVLRPFSLAHQRQETLKALQSQALVMPAVVGQLQAMMAQMAQQGQALNAQLLANQDSFSREAKTAYADLATSVDRSLKASLADSVRMAGEAIQPVVQATMNGLARDAGLLHEQTASAVQHQLQGLSTQFGSTVSGVAEGWTTALANHERASQALTAGLATSLTQFTDTFEQRSATLLGLVAETTAQQSAALRTDLAVADQARLDAMQRSLSAVSATLQQAWQQAGAHTLGQQERICQTLEQTARDIHAQAEAHAKNTIAEIARLTHTAAEAPRAAADMMVALRSQLSDSLVRDNALLEERSRIMATLGTLLDTVNKAATEQRAAIDALVGSSTTVLTQVGAQFNDQVQAESTRMTEVAAQVVGSAVEVASLGEVFGAAVQRFSDTSDALMAHLQRIEASLDKSMARSDEQLGYYVAQAREIIDLSIGSQRQIVDDLQQLAVRQAPLAEEVR